jgi:hypothetical protein
MIVIRTSAAVLLGLLFASSGWSQDNLPGPGVTAPDQAIEPESYESLRQKLDKPISAEFVETPLKDIVDYLAAAIGCQIVLDHRSLEEAAISVDTPVTINLRNIKAATLLKRLLASEIGRLDFVRRDGFIEISNVTKLETQWEWRIYFARDLPGVTPEAPDVSEVIELIQSTIEPSSWQAQGGEGNIVHLQSILVIRQSPRVHDRIDELLHATRKAMAEAAKPTRSE